MFSLLFFFFAVTSSDSVWPNVALQEQVNPWNQIQGGTYMWTGGDVDCSVALNETARLFVFGDSLIGGWSRMQRRRWEWPGGFMPHSSVGLLSDGDDGKTTMRYFWKQNQSWFEPGWADGKTRFFWPLGQAVRVAAETCVLGDQILVNQHGPPPFNFHSNGSYAVCFTGVGNGQQRWLPPFPFSNDNITFSNSAFVDEDGHVYFFGSSSSSSRSSSSNHQQILARVDVHDFGDWRLLQFLTASGAWVAHTHSLASLFGSDVVSEFSVGQCECCSAASRFFVLSIAFAGTDVLLRTAPRLVGPWSAPEPIFSIPAPFNDTSKFFCYAVKLHQDTTFSFVCNAWKLASLFAPHNRAMYVPQFFHFNLCR